jgi:hypothetical protein
MDPEDDSQREAGAYHMSKSCAITLRKIFLPEKNSGPFKFVSKFCL